MVSLGYHTKGEDTTQLYQMLLSLFRVLCTLSLRSLMAFRGIFSRRNLQLLTEGTTAAEQKSVRSFVTVPIVPDGGPLRLFFAVKLTDELQDAISEVAKTSREQLESFVLEHKLKRVRASWVHRDNYHLTLKFLGDTNQSDIEGLVSEVATALESFSSFRMHVSKLGVFPTEKKPRVLWVGARDHVKSLQRLAEEIDVITNTKLSLPREKRRFEGHITLARFKDQVHFPRNIGPVFMDTKVNLGRCPVTEVYLLQSVDTGNGVRYEEVACIPLKGGPMCEEELELLEVEVESTIITTATATAP
eukprot:Colp12_sorted_trinity150504_noHs@2257